MHTTDTAIKLGNIEACRVKVNQYDVPDDVNVLYY